VRRLGTASPTSGSDLKTLACSRWHGDGVCKFLKLRRT
jgi:hypothetical protein